MNQLMERKAAEAFRASCCTFPGRPDEAGPGDGSGRRPDGLRDIRRKAQQHPVQSRDELRADLC